MPFKSWQHIWLAIQASVVIFPFIGLLYSLLTARANKKAETSGPTVILFIAIAIVLAFYWYDLLTESFSGSPFGYILSSTAAIICLGVVALGWLYYTIKIVTGKTV